MSSSRTSDDRQPVEPDAVDDLDTDLDDDLDDPGFDPTDPAIYDDIDPDDAQAMAEELAEVRAKLAQVPAAQVVANHAMGLFELAAIHLNQPKPVFSEAALAIDALGAIVEGLGPERLGEAGPTLMDALQQIRLAFVHLKNVDEA